MPRWASYMSAVSLAGATFTGLYTAYAHRTAGWVILWATANAIVLGFVTAGRLTIIWSTALFMNGVLVGALRSSGPARRLTKMGVARALGFTLIALFFLGVMVGVRQVRGGSDNFSGSTRELIPYSPVLRASPEDSLWLNAAVANYFYVTGSIPALDYRLAEKSMGDDHTLGRATFAFVFRLLGVDLPRYEEFSPIPMPINVYTSLGDWYKDFGWPGIVGIAYLLGIWASYLYQRALSRRGSTTGAAILAFLLLWIEFSVFFTATFHGSFWVALFWSIIVGVLIDFRLVWRRTRPLLPQESRSL